MDVDERLAALEEFASRIVRLTGTWVTLSRLRGPPRGKRRRPACRARSQLLVRHQGVDHIPSSSYRRVCGVIDRDIGADHPLGTSGEAAEAHSPDEEPKAPAKRTDGCQDVAELNPAFRRWLASKVEGVRSLVLHAEIALRAATRSNVRGDYDQTTLASARWHTPAEPARKAKSSGQRGRAILAMVSAFVALGGAPISASVPATNGWTHPTYDPTSHADRKLQQFDRSHPDCDLWTDWHKLCSRMGENGETTCRTDPYHRAKPSAPFCADYETARPDTLAEAQSRSRFCVKFGRGQPEPPGAHYCGRYRSERPFNGVNIENLRTPECLEWGTYSVPCTENKQNGGALPLCSSANLRKAPPTVAYACVKWAPTGYCRHPVGGREPERLSGGLSLLMPPPPQTIQPVWGVYCHTYGE